MNIFELVQLIHAFQQWFLTNFTVAPESAPFEIWIVFVIKQVVFLIISNLLSKIYTRICIDKNITATSIALLYF